VTPIIDPYLLSQIVTSLAAAISQSFPDDDALNAVGLAFTQLGDTIALLALQRARVRDAAASPEEKNGK